ncbi:hypothetical protein [Chamaesiphon sp. VAR_48_metabat_403]|nr:hypothetical protein [Chamaesiphon sp. VAR_48_metabat_403]
MFVSDRVGGASLKENRTQACQLSRSFQNLQVDVTQLKTLNAFT